MHSPSAFKIIVIDDNPAIQHDFTKILTPNFSLELNSLKKQLFDEEINNQTMLPEFEIDFASQGQEGYEKIAMAFKKGQPYSLAFVDIRMPPGWDGIKTIKQIWKLDKDIQIVICTAYSDYSWEETIKHLGKTDNLLILKKPFDNISVRQLACALTRKWELAVQSKHYTKHLRDIVAERTQELEYQAMHDPLTGLANRLKLTEALQQLMDKTLENKTSFAVLFLDLDRFKLINDSLSHNVGDEILVTAAKRLKLSVGSKDLLVRLGGDEFIVLLANVEPHSVSLINKISKILKAFQLPFSVANRKIILTASIGVALFPNDGQTVDVLLRNADTAMYQAKAQKGNNFKFYTSEMSAETINKLDKEMQLRQALANREFFLVYQPQINLLENKLEAVEALIRWQHPTKGLLLPIDFIPLAEETGLIVQICEWVLRMACQQNKKWQENGFPFIRIAVNVTAAQFKQGNLVESVKHILQETNLEPQYLELELTENVLLSNLEIIDCISELKKLGIIIAIDDFGTGYSSLSYLHQLPLDRLKIDASFIQHIKSPTDDEVIIKAVIAMAKSLNLEVLAEGVETKTQLNFLKKHECRKVQGFYFSKPLLAHELENYLQDPSSIIDSLSSVPKI